MQKITKELEEAIKAMPEKEKDKILLRLIRKDHMLIKKLHFELLQDEADMEMVRDKLLFAIKKRAENNYSHTPGLLMMDMRDCSGAISRHVKVTKDKYGEIQLTIAAVNEFFKYNYEEVLVSGAHRADKFATYVCNKAQLVLKKLEKMHEDMYLEFEEGVNEMLRNVYRYKPTERIAIEIGLPKEFVY